MEGCIVHGDAVYVLQIALLHLSLRAFIIVSVESSALAIVQEVEFVGSRRVFGDQVADVDI